MIYWLFGQPAAGKTTLTKELIKRLNPVKYVHIDGDNLRSILKNQDYTEGGRDKNLQSVLDIARFSAAHDNDVFISVVAPYNRHRESLADSNDVVQVYVHTTEIRGREDYFVDEIEITKDAIWINTTNRSIEESVLELINKIDYHIVFNK